MTLSKRKQQILKIYQKDNLIVYDHQKHGAWYADYSPILYEILHRDDVTGFLRNDVRLVFKFMENGKRRDTSFTELCYCCHGGMITSPERNVYKDILEFRNTVRKDRQLDHLDGFVRNNTGLNLSMVSSAVNKQKAQITLKFCPPYNLTSIFQFGKYYVRLQWEEELSGDSEKDFPYFICHDEGSLLSSLRYLYHEGLDLGGVTCTPEQACKLPRSELTRFSRSEEGALLSIKKQSELLELVKNTPGLDG